MERIRAFARSQLVPHNLQISLDLFFPGRPAVGRSHKLPQQPLRIPRRRGSRVRLSPAIDVDGAKITDGYHNLSHHGQNPTKLAELAVIDMWHMKLLAGLLSNLKTTLEAGEPLLDRTMVLCGSNFGDATT
jgi:hypothetical protein